MAWRGLAKDPPIGGNPRLAGMEGAHRRSSLLLCLLFLLSHFGTRLSLTPVSGDPREVSFDRGPVPASPPSCYIQRQGHPPARSPPLSLRSHTPPTSEKKKKKKENCPALEDWQSAPVPGNLFRNPARLRLQYPEGSALLLCWPVHHHDCF